MDKNGYLIELSEAILSRAFEEQSDVHKVFTAIWALEGEVNNGGFDQFFLNQSGSIANFTPAALRRIGAAQCAGIVENAIRVVSADPLPADDDARQALLLNLDDEASGRLESLDSEFYAYPDDLTALLFEFVRGNPAEFGPAPA